MTYRFMFAFQKCSQLKKALEESSGSGEACYLLRIDLMSSKESSTEVDENGNHKPVFLVRRLPWERIKTKQSMLIQTN